MQLSTKLFFLLLSKQEGNWLNSTGFTVNLKECNTNRYYACVREL